MKATVLSLIFAAVLPVAAFAHPLAPALLEVTESTPGTIRVRWKTSLWKEGGSRQEPKLPAGCTPTSEPRTTVDATSVTRSWDAQCVSATLVGARFGVERVGTVVSDTLVRIQLADGRSYQAILREGDDSFTVPARQPRTMVLREYAALGVEHILGGVDHLLFVFGLVLLVPVGRQLLWTVSAFTLGHSVTLSLAVLGYTDFPAGVIEVLIAASVLALAVELARTHPPNPLLLEREAGVLSSPSLSKRGGQGVSLLRRQPWLMAGAFGLLHGLGFAGALREAGLPAGEIPAALLAFNAGIEVGQLAFIALVLLVGRVMRPLLHALPLTATRAPVYAMGSLAAFWLFERAAALV